MEAPIKATALGLVEIDDAGPVGSARSVEKKRKVVAQRDHALTETEQTEVASERGERDGEQRGQPSNGTLTAATGFSAGRGRELRSGLRTWVRLPSGRHPGNCLGWVICPLGRQPTHRDGDRGLPGFRAAFDHAELLEIVAQRRRRGIAVIPLRLHRTGDDAVEAGVDTGDLPGCGRKGPSRHAAGEHLVEHDPDGIEVGPTVQFDPGTVCLRSGVIGRADHISGKGQIPRGPPCQHGETKVGHLHRSLRIEEYVGRLDVPVDDPEFVGGVQRVADAQTDRAGVARREANLLREPSRDVRALDQLHHEIEMTERCFPSVEHGDDVGMGEPGEGAGLVDKAIEQGGVSLSEFRREELQGDMALEVELKGPVNGSHSSATDEPLDPVAGNQFLQLCDAGRLPGVLPGLPVGKVEGRGYFRIGKIFSLACHVRRSETRAEPHDEGSFTRNVEIGIERTEPVVLICYVEKPGADLVEVAVEPVAGEEVGLPERVVFPGGRVGRSSRGIVVEILGVEVLLDPREESGRRIPVQ